jgi:1,4-dihydroxy-2-naphthoate octaprenyltransferase
MPFVSWFVVAFFQGSWTVAMVWVGVLNNIPEFDFTAFWQYPLAALFFLGGSYPVTQIYQHEEDRERGDITISILAGVRGTFIIAGIGILSGTSILLSGLWSRFSLYALVLMLSCSLPSILFFSFWANQSFIDPKNADFQSTMRFNVVSSVGLSIGFLSLLCLNIWANSLHLHP